MALEASKGFAPHKILTCRHPTDYSGQFQITTNQTLSVGFILCVLIEISYLAEHTTGPGGQKADRRGKALEHKCTREQVGSF